MLSKSSNPVRRAAQALAAADGVAHLAFFSVFGWRTVVGSGWRLVQTGFAVLALAGMACSVIGWTLVKHGGKTRARAWGLWAIAASTALAGLLLVVASWTGD